MSVVHRTVRNIPSAANAAIAQIAKANRRTTNDEIVIAIEEHVAAHATRKTALSIAETITDPMPEDVADLMGALKRSLSKRTVRARKSGAR